jgi:hypothetical protein
MEWRPGILREAVHHWRSWFHIDLPSSVLVFAAARDESVLMRFSLEGNTVLSNGYSIVEYPKGIEGDKGGKGKIDLEKVEKMWTGEDERWKHKFPLREKLGRDRTVTFGIVKTEVLPGVGARQTYIDRAERKDDKAVNGGMDGVELVWLF